MNPGGIPVAHQRWTTSKPLKDDGPPHNADGRERFAGNRDLQVNSE